MDTTYIILISSTAMILLLVVLMVGGTLAYIFREQVEWRMKAEMMADLRNYIPGDSSDSVTRSWDEAQSQLQ